MADIEFAEPDLNIYCTSTELDVSIGADLDLEYDVCVRIGNPLAFETQIRSGIKRAYSATPGTLEAAAGYLTYEDRTINQFQNELHIGPFFKDLKYSTQKEFRFAYLFHNREHVFKLVEFDATDCELSIAWSR